MDDAVFDTLVIGPLSRDINIDCTGHTVEETGGAVVQSAFASAAGGNRTAVLTRAAEKDRSLCSVFNISAENIFFTASRTTTSIVNKYLTADKERRICTALSVCDPFTPADIPAIRTKIYHFAGLIAGDFSGELVIETSRKGMVAVDVQAFLRNAIDGRMEFRDWKEKKEVLPYIRFLKTDAAEAQVLTGTDDRYAAARQLYDWGAREIMISHNTELIVYDGKEICACPIKSRNLSGRTGRGDTAFAAYITERLRENPSRALLYAAATVSLKMETPGPFRGTRADVERYIAEFYRESAGIATAGA